MLKPGGLVSTGRSRVEIQRGVKLEQVKSGCEIAKKLLWICVIDQRLLVNQKMAIYQECESRLRPVESADVPAGIEVRKM